jgi:hypothetical protein
MGTSVGPCTKDRPASRKDGFVDTLCAEAGRGLHSSTFQLNLSALYGIGGARTGCVARIKGVFRVCRVFSCDRDGLG